ncbi:hypothetical protein [Gaiella sp.]|uniref:WD40/YVTN/BNR-like repeat-containing protein n=1 Tax=Gaiella sp. TaxID=2663207 RepID=UPI002E344EC6|nr:hypothetical protein [Gaiella sp.]HEX5584083.1 hypothetical protein [Gaiella sp.]
MAGLFVATGDAIVRLDETDGEWVATRALVGSGAQCLAVDSNTPGRVYAGLREGGVRRSDDGGGTWIDCGLPEPGVFSLAVSPAYGTVYAGTEPSRLFASRDSGETWEALDALLDLPSRPSWSFPPRPWTSHVRWVAPSPHEASLLLVGIELGGLMRSADGGRSWDDHRPGAQRDVHCLAWHPGVQGRAYEAGGGGAAFSVDGGETWSAADDGRDRHYTWALSVDPADPDLWYVSASTGPFAAHGRGEPQAHVYRRHGDEPWTALGGGLPEPLPAMPYALVAAEDRLYAGLSDGQLWESRDRGDTWAACRITGEGLTALHALALA